jgi:hypothetical protein
VKSTLFPARNVKYKLLHSDTYSPQNAQHIEVSEIDHECATLMEKIKKIKEHHNINKEKVV